jgi:hypothetical protein
MNSNFETELNGKIIEVLPEIKPNSVILARFGSAPVNIIERFVESIKKLVAERKLSPVLLMLIPVYSDMEIEILDEDRMREFGWVRIEKIEEKTND